MVRLPLCHHDSSRQFIVFVVWSIEHRTIWSICVKFVWECISIFFYLFVCILSPCYLMVHEFVGKSYFGGFAKLYAHTIYWPQIKILDWIYIMLRFSLVVYRAPFLVHCTPITSSFYVFRIIFRWSFLCLISSMIIHGKCCICFLWKLLCKVETGIASECG